MDWANIHGAGQCLIKLASDLAKKTMVVVLFLPDGFKVQFHSPCLQRLTCGLLTLRVLLLDLARAAQVLPILC